ncbi:MAG TPA: hypothetical protein VL485_00390 [Ktedonobacteraceae bacterium]|nr:hypothetical protein [Ktedonobacteraceae bacterium]
MSTDSYREVLKQVQQLAPTEQLRLMEDLAEMLNEQLESLKNVETTIHQIEEKLQIIQDAIEQAHEEIKFPKQYSITELCGLGKEIWDGVDAQEYVNQERDSWDG